MRFIKLALAILITTTIFCSSSGTQDYPKLKIADGYVQVDKVTENHSYLEVFVYNGSTEAVGGMVTVMRAPNLSSNRAVISIPPGKTESAIFSKVDRDKIVTWEEIKLHNFYVK